MSQTTQATAQDRRSQTAASLMREDFLRASEHFTVAQAIDQLKRERYYRHFYNVYILSDDCKLRGALDLKELLRAPPEKRLAELPAGTTVSVPPDMDQEEVAELFSRADIVEAPVADSDGCVLGAISVDDVVDVLIQEHTEDVFRARGLEHAPPAGRSLTGLSVWQHFRARMPWLLLSLVGGLVAGAIIHTFQARLEALILALVIFIPFIMALGGNIGSQSATLFVREQALETVGNTARYFLKEIAVGLMIGGTIGVIVGIVAWAWQGSAVIGWIVGLASLATSLAAVLIGIFIPWLFDRIGIDTALSSGPLVTTLKDITGLLIYFGVAVMILRLAGL